MSGNNLFRWGAHLRHGTVSKDARQMFLTGGREADAFYRQRFSHDKIVRSTHGVNCTGSCSWKVYVKDGMITWESQETDYPSTGPDMPDYEPRGCPRGAAFSWYEYSPTRIRHPYVRGALLAAYRQAKKDVGGDPVDAWRRVVTTPELRNAYVSQRGKGGMVRTSYEEANEIIAAATVSTTKEYGPDRLAGFSVIPAMSQVSYGAGSRFLELMGGTMLSFYDWYADLSQSSPLVFGDQTDVPESGDWFNSDYLLVWGSNVSVTRTPDAHFLTEARYHGTKVVVFAPDYSDTTKFADEWVRLNPGTDGAFAMAMGHVILTEFYEGKRTPFFLDYMKRYTDAPFLVTLDAREDGTVVPSHFLTASEVGGDLAATPRADFRLLVMDEDGTVKDPGGTDADAFGEGSEGKWNLTLEGVSPRLSLYDDAESKNPAATETATLSLPRFDLPGQAGAGQASTGPIGAGVLHRGVPVTRVNGHLVTTVYDIMLAQYGVARPGLPGTWPTGYDDASEPYTPAWQEEQTGVSPNQVIRIAREFAHTAIGSGGRCQVIMGAGINHYFHSDDIYRTILALTTMCGTQGRNGGGWAHYVGQEKVRPITGWQQYAMALDWQRPARQMIATGLWYMLTSQWRYDTGTLDRFESPLASGKMDGYTVPDSLVEATQRGWMPGYPQFDRSSLDLAAEASEAGLEPGAYVARELEAGRLHFAIEDPDAEPNYTKVLFNWRTNLLGSSAKGTEFFLRHMLGADNDVQAEELPEGKRPKKIKWREAVRGKLDLMVTADFRNTSTTLHSDVVMPAATWYEKNDISTTDMHPYIHTFNPAIQPPWDARTDFEWFGDLALACSAMGAQHLGKRTDILTVPLPHDTPDELSNPHGEFGPRERVGWVPGKTMPKIVPIERDYGRIYEKWSTVGPLPEKVGMATKRVNFDAGVAGREVRELGERSGTLPTAIGPRPAVDTAVKAANMIMALSGTTCGEVAVDGWENLEKKTGQHFTDLAEDERGKRIDYADIVSRPSSVITSPEWTGSEHGGRRYSAFVVNVERNKPFHTLSGRMHYYLDHQWLRDFGEQLPIYRPPLDFQHLYGEAAPGTVARDGSGQAEVAVRYLTVHNKWSIHSSYYDNQLILTLGRGGQAVWMSPADAEKVGVRDNDWVEIHNRNGVVSARAVVSQRIPEGTAYMHHAQERMVGTPLNESTGKRGGTHNSITRILLKPAHLIGGYGHMTYGFNYIGPTGNQRDEVAFIRRRSQEVEF